MRASFLRLLLCFCILIGLFGLPSTDGRAQEENQAEALLSRMTPG